MNTALDEKTFNEIKEHVYYVSEKAMMAKFNLDKVHETLKNDVRIAYDYMKQHSTFLNSIEYGTSLEGDDMAHAVRKDLSRYSGGNSEVVQEYMQNATFKEHVSQAYNLRELVNKESIQLEETFVKHRFPSEQRGVAVIIHKAEHDLYEVFDKPEKIGKELRQELTGLIRHEPFKKSQAEIEQDQKALAEFKEQQAIRASKRQEVSMER